MMCLKFIVVSYLELQIQLVNGTNQFTVFFLQLCFEILPIVSRLLITILLVDGSNDIKNREPPPILFLVPYRPNFTVVEKTNRFFMPTIIKLLIWGVNQILWINLQDPCYLK